jgi:peptide-methionine (S)-S-oxide reductase
MVTVSRGFEVKTRILGTSLGVLLLASTVVEVWGQDPTTTASKVQSRKTTASKVKRKGSAAGVKAAAGAQSAASPDAVSGGSDGLINGSSAASNSTTGADSAKATDAGSGDPLRSASDSEKPKTEFATFGAGCFWHVEAEFEWLPGVKSAVSGYSGGRHAEVVQVEYDPAVISYEKLLRVFWSGHDPTQLNRQGPDYGPQYRSVIFYHSAEQKRAALASYQELTKARVFRAPIVTQLMPMQAFFPAEEYHQNYYGGRDGRPATRKAKRPRKPVTTSGASAAKAQSAKVSGSSKPRASNAGVSSVGEPSNQRVIGPGAGNQ